MADHADSSDSGSQSPVATSDAPSSHSFFDPSNIPAAAVREVQHVFIFGGTFFSTVIALLASAFGVVAALAWSRAIFDWLPTVPLLNFHDPLVREFADAGVTTLVAVVVVLFLGVVNARLKTRSKLPSFPPPQQQATGEATSRRKD
jgi:hypothetical protein